MSRDMTAEDRNVYLLAEIERLRIDLKRARDEAGVVLSEENDALIDEVKRLRAALEFYASGSISAAEDGGKEARRALEPKP